MRSEWTTTTIGNLLSSRRGASPRPIQKYLSDSGVPWVKISDVTKINTRTITSTRQYVSEEGAKKSVRVFPGDLILSNSATPGIPKFMGIEACVHDGWLVLRDFKGLDKEFAYWLLLNERKKLVKKGNGSVFVNLKTETLNTHTVKLPPLIEQLEIVNVLNSLQDKIESNEKIAKKVETFLRDLFKDLFVDFGPSALENTNSREIYPEFVQKMFPKKVSAKGGFKKPSGWKDGILGNYLEIGRGGSPRPIKDFIVEEGLPWTKIADATANDSPFLVKTKEFIREEGLKKTVLMKRGSLILSNSATPGLPRFLSIDACIHDGWLHFPKIEVFSKYYLYFLFLELRESFIKQGSGSIFTNLKTDIVRNFRVVEPPIELIEYFSSIAKDLLDLVEKLVFESETLVNTRDVVLKEVLSGQLNIYREQT